MRACCDISLATPMLFNKLPHLYCADIRKLFIQQLLSREVEQAGDHPDSQPSHHLQQHLLWEHIVQFHISWNLRDPSRSEIR